MPKHSRDWYRSQILNDVQPLSITAVARGLHRRRGRGSLLPDGPNGPSGRAPDAARSSTKTTDTND